MNLFTSIINRSDPFQNDKKDKSLEKFAHLKALDGYRGVLALWVYFGHLANAVGFKNYVLSMHALSVDLFMVLSGFLMVHTWKTAITFRQTFSFDFYKTVIPFYVNRFFRIAPLYYFLLLICYCFLSDLAEMHDYSQNKIPPPWAQGLNNFASHTEWNFSNFKWLFLHGSFAFGAVPGMESTTPLPDWSLSLEMQFYLILPALLLLFGRINIVVLAMLSAVLAIYTPSLLGSYLNAGSIAHFGQPSFITYRLNAFMAGMMMAFWLRNRQLEKPSIRFDIFTLIAGVICIYPLHKPVILGFVIFVLLVLYRVPGLYQIFSHKYLRFLGDISYSVYLSHLLIVIPAVFWLIQRPSFMTLTTSMRFLLAVCLTAPLVILVGYLLFRAVEIPSIRLGKYLLSR